MKNLRLLSLIVPLALACCFGVAIEIQLYGDCQVITTAPVLGFSIMLLAFTLAIATNGTHFSQSQFVSLVETFIAVFLVTVFSCLVVIAPVLVRQMTNSGVIYGR